MAVLCVKSNSIHCVDRSFWLAIGELLVGVGYLGEGAEMYLQSKLEDSAHCVQPDFANCKVLDFFQLYQVVGNVYRILVLFTETGVISL